MIKTEKNHWRFCETRWGEKFTCAQWNGPPHNVKLHGRAVVLRAGDVILRERDGGPFVAILPSQAFDAIFDFDTERGGPL